mmetsp:Transcript_40794/g.107786  ORF Transcript_40794/g.107786 Transcript_40794/m.107786 type:complete len:236 (-) Transcript_40794:386-1093(-)
MAEELDEPREDSGDDEVADAVGRFAHVRQRPTRIHQHLLVRQANQSDERGQRRRDQLPPRRRLATNEVGDSPRGVTDKGEVVGRVHVAHRCEQARQHVQLQVVGERKVTAARAVASDVAERPHCLLTNISVWARDKADEDGDGTIVDDDARVLRRPRRDVRQRPRRLKEQWRVVVALAELHEARHSPDRNDLCNRRVALNGEELSEARCRLELFLRCRRLEQLKVIREAIQLRLE